MNNNPTSFRDKWTNNQDLAFATTLTEGSEIQKWILARNGFSTLAEFGKYLAPKRRILDAGCGNGRVTALLRSLTDPRKTEVVGIDLVADEVAARNLADSENVLVRRKDLLDDLSDLGKFDFIYSQEVLHHTNDPRRAFANLVKLLTDDGEIAIYVYKQKAPVREFTDDYVRDRISSLDYDSAMRACDQITELGKTLSELDTKVRVPAVDVLGIEAGEYDLQRFLYHFFCKCFWNNELSFKDNSVINYDWYHPQVATRHTLEEVRDWCAENNLKIRHECVDHYGITVRAARV